MSKVTAKYQVTIPINVRKELGIVPGTEVDIKKEGKKYVLVVDQLKKSGKNGVEGSRANRQQWNIWMKSEAKRIESLCRYHF